MFVVNEVIQRQKKEGTRKCMAFLDKEEAYDRVDRRLLCKVLERIGISGKIIRIIRSMHENTRTFFTKACSPNSFWYISAERSF